MEKTVLIGRMGTNLKVGIVGLPNVGKVKPQLLTLMSSLFDKNSLSPCVSIFYHIDFPQSTFFNVLTKSSQAAAENFPFCTIDPNEVSIDHYNFGGKLTHIFN